MKQNYVVKIITKIAYISKQNCPLYNQLRLLASVDIYKLEVLKFMPGLKKILLKRFNDYFTLKFKTILPGLLVMITWE